MLAAPLALMEIVVKKSFAVGWLALFWLVWKLALDLQLEGKQALVTGQHGGKFGYAIAAALLEAAADVIVNGRF